MRKEFLLLIVGVLGLGILLYFISPLSHLQNGEETAPTEAAPAEEVVAEIPATPPPTETAPVPAPVVPSPVESPGKNPQVMKVFAQKLREMGTCLETANNVPGDELEPNLQTLIDSVRGEWGESVISTEDWRQIEMETPEGEKRRLRIEMDFDSDTQVQRKLKYMTVQADGQTTPIPVAEDQAIEPSETLIASLESGNKVITQEKFERIYFSNGEEIVAKQKDGLLSELEVNKGPKSFKCTSLSEEQSTCQCIQ